MLTQKQTANSGSSVCQACELGQRWAKPDLLNHMLTYSVILTLLPSRNGNFWAHPLQSAGLWLSCDQQNVVKVTLSLLRLDYKRLPPCSLKCFHLRDLNCPVINLTILRTTPPLTIRKPSQMEKVHNGSP